MRSFTANPLFVTVLSSEPGGKSLFSLGPFIKPPWIPADFPDSRAVLSYSSNPFINLMSPPGLSVQIPCRTRRFRNSKNGLHG